MKRIVFCADVQLHNHPQNASVLDNGLNSRFYYGLETLKQAARVANGGTLVINGDLFDHRRFLEIDVLVHTYRTITEIARTLDKVIIVVGNHDQFLRDGSVHSTEIFKFTSKNIVVVDTWQIIDLGPEYGSTSLCCHAFSLDIESVKDFVINKASLVGGILVLHQEVVGASMGHSICEKGLRMDDLHADKFTYVMLGHFHAPQSLAANVFYIGSPYQVDRSEAGDQKRFLVWEAGKLSQHNVTGIPRYLSFPSVEAYEKAKREGDVSPVDFVDFVVGDTDYEKAKKLADTSPTMKAIYVPEEKAGDGSPSAAVDLEDMSVVSAVCAYLERTGGERLKEEALARLSA